MDLKYKSAMFILLFVKKNRLQKTFYYSFKIVFTVSFKIKILY